VQIKKNLDVSKKEINTGLVDEEANGQLLPLALQWKPGEYEEAENEIFFPQFSYVGMLNRRMNCRVKKGGVSMRG